MFALLLTLLILDGILMVVVILLQAGKGGGLAAMGGGGGGAGTDNFLGSRQAATVLTKATWTTGAIFIGLSVVLSIMSSRSQDAAPLLQEEFRQEQPAAPQPVLPGADEAPGEGAPEGAGEVIPGLEPDAGDSGDSGNDQ
ncbi:MAG TPA: preprotein translocase subunit SecG [Longimicrobiales bacterium]|nr:preprotein translocase subunit SecG [Longimicrobiales bacterium]